jgi:hypothetical protein
VGREKSDARLPNGRDTDREAGRLDSGDDEMAEAESLTDVTQAYPRNEFRGFGKSNVCLRRQKMWSRAVSAVHAGGGFIGVTIALLQTWNSFQERIVRNISH